MAKVSRFSKWVNSINSLPSGVAGWVLNRLVRGFSPFAASNGIRVVSLSRRECIAQVKNRSAVRGKNGAIHQYAIALTAEIAAHCLLKMNSPEGLEFELQSSTIKQPSRSSGSVRVCAKVTDETVLLLHKQGSGSTSVNVHIEDNAGRQPLVCDMLWNWHTQKLLT